MKFDNIPDAVTESGLAAAQSLVNTALQNIVYLGQYSAYEFVFLCSGIEVVARVAYDKATDSSAIVNALPMVESRGIEEKKPVKRGRKS